MKNFYAVLLLSVPLIPSAARAQSAPRIDSIKPLLGKSGTTVKLFGQHFSTTPAGNAVYFGGMKASVAGAWTDSLLVTVPAGAAYGPLSVSSGGLVAVSQLPFQPTYQGYDTLSSSTLTTSVELSAGWQPYGLVNADFDGDGRNDLIAVNSASNTVTVLRNNGNGNGDAFTVSTYFPVGFYCNSIIAGDINGDGKADLVLTAGNDNKLLVMRNTSIAGTIAFDAPLSLTTASLPRQAAIADLDGDGKPDIVTANFLDRSLSVFRNNGIAGNLLFGAKLDFPVGSLFPNSVVATDLNGDNRPDLAVSVTNPTGIDSLTILLNAGSPSFVFESGNSWAVADSVTMISTADVDLDGRNDLLLGSFSPGYITIFRNTTTGNVLSLAPKLQLPASTESEKVAIGDIDGDGKPELAVTTKAAGTISVYRNRSTPGLVRFNERQVFNAGSSPADLVITDLNLDGKTDIAVTNQVGSKVVVLRNVSSEPLIKSFTPTAGNTNTVVTIKGQRLSGINAVSFGGVPAQVFTVVNDSTIQATVGSGATGNVRVSSPAGSYERSLFLFGSRPAIAGFSPALGAAGTSVVITGGNFSSYADSNIVYFGGGKATITAASPTSLTVNVPTTATYAPVTVTTGLYTAYSHQPFLPSFSGMSQLHDTSFTQPVNFSTGGRARSVTLADLDADGKLDAVVLDNTGKLVSILRNTGVVGGWAFGQRIDSVTGSNPFMVVTEDLDGDGRKDIVIAELDGSHISVHKNNSVPGTLSFGPRKTFNTGENPVDLAVRDMNNDGKPDVVTVNSNGHSISVLQNLSTASTISFAAKVDFATGQWPHGLSIDDLTGDGKPDVVVANHDGKSISLLRNTSQGGALSFAPKIDQGVGGIVYCAVTADFNGDGLIDIAATNASTGRVLVFRNLGVTSDTVRLAPPKEIVTTGQPLYIAAADLNGDGKPDLAIAEMGSFLSMYENTSSVDSISWDPRTSSPVENFAQTLAIGDLTGDGKPDIVAAKPLSGAISVIVNKSSHAGIVASGSNPVSGPVNNQIFCDTIVNTYQGVPFVQRHYDLSPANNAATATGTVTLYFTQADFDQYNLHPAHGKKLPVGPADQVNKANLVIFQFHGTSVTGLPGSYTSAGNLIDPDDSKIVWNTAAKRWEVTFDVTGFSGFFVTSAGNSLLTLAPATPAIGGITNSYCSTAGIQTAKLTNLPVIKEGTKVLITLDGKLLSLVQDSLFRFNPDTLSGGSHLLKATYSNVAAAKVTEQSFEVVKAILPAVDLSANITNIMSLTSEVVVTASHTGGGTTPLFTFARDKAFTSILQAESSSQVLRIDPALLTIGDNKVFVKMKTSLTCYTLQTDVDSLLLRRDATTGIADPNAPGQLIRLFPNPFTETMYVSGLNSGKAYQVVLYDSRGTIAYRAVVKNRSVLEIPAAGLRSGIYWLSVYDDKRQLIGSEKILKQ
ncbi:FG-GAP-like repeat-containing protein [Paraflavitalea pollutisoli]|uniref:FG-GAP-like repeat-containing protein n=1 Tax=Paraflavitalea pollutisoli TaxID=3034143 RepID=UPI0023ED5B79|nr:FG-GAP-like repeat-containing protein [Paraflavitalea sp. H1-2-19X]